MKAVTRRGFLERLTQGAAALVGAVGVSSSVLADAPESQSTDADKRLVAGNQAFFGQNAAMRNFVYCGSDLISYDYCVYDTPAHALLNDGATGVLSVSKVSYTYSGEWPTRVEYVVTDESATITQRGVV